MDNPYDQGFRAGYLGGPKLPPAGKHEREIYCTGYRDGRISANRNAVVARWVQGAVRGREMSGGIV